MKKKRSFEVFSLVILGVFLGLAGAVLTSQAKPEPLERKIVVFKPGVLNKHAREALIKKFGGVKTKDLTLIDGEAVLLPPKAQALLVKEAGVLRIDDDVEIYALEGNRGSDKLLSSQPAEQLTWNIARVNANQVWVTTTGDPIKVGIIDTGIQLNHPDLAANIKGGYNAINPRKSANDDNGHGTHVAGAAAALDNEIGVIGVGPKIDLYAVKVLNAAGSGYLSDVIEGLDWAIQNGMQVVNMSLGASVDIQSFREAVKRVNAAGIVQVAAAGNNYGGAVDYPAAYDEVIAVSATGADDSNTIAYFSSRGPEVDLAAPGVNIYSTYKGSNYKTLSGTSMAAPHVTGVAALVIDVFKLAGTSTPYQVQQKLESTATDLGTAGKDNLYGSGLVNALTALTR